MFRKLGVSKTVSASSTTTEQLNYSNMSKKSCLDVFGFVPKVPDKQPKAPVATFDQVRSSDIDLSLQHYNVLIHTLLSTC